MVSHWLRKDRKMSQNAHKTTEKPKRRPEKIYLRVTPYGLAPADPYAETRLREKKYKVGDVLSAQLSKLRKSGTHKNAHKIGVLMMQSHDDFRYYASAHDVLKRLQLESGAACEEIKIRKLGGEWELHRYPLSFSFDSLGEAEFDEAVRVICRYIVDVYWPDMSPEEIDLMAERMPNE